MTALPQLGIILCTLLGASTIVIAEPLVASVPPLYLLWVRFAIAALLLAITIPHRIFPLTRDSLLSGFVAGAGFGLGSVLLYLSLQHVRAGKVTFLMALEVLIVPIISALLFKNKVTRIEWFALIPAVLGLWLICGDTQGPLSLWELAALASAFAYSAYTIAQSRLASSSSITSRTFVSCVTIGMLAFCASSFFESESPRAWSPDAILSLAYLVVLGTVARFLIQAWAQRSVSASFTAMTFTAEPVFAIALSYTFLGERFTTTQSLGALGIIFAVVLTNYQVLVQAKALSQRN
jgi:drug/metabolite transporter (DMT)-like permease